MIRRKRGISSGSTLFATVPMLFLCCSSLLFFFASVISLLASVVSLFVHLSFLWFLERAALRDCVGFLGIFIYISAFVWLVLVRPHMFAMIIPINLPDPPICLSNLTSR